MRKLIFLLLFFVGAVFAATSGDCYKSCSSSNDPECAKNCFIKENQIVVPPVSPQNTPTTDNQQPNANSGGIQLYSVPPPEPKTGYGSPSLFDKLKSQPMQRNQAVPLVAPEMSNQSTTDSTPQPASIFH